MNENDPIELEELMATWQGSDDGRLTWMREDFSKRRLSALAQDFWVLAGLATGIVVLAVKAILVPEAVTIFAAVFFCPYFAANMWVTVNRLRTRRGALPLSGPEYLSAMLHNLDLDLWELRWEQRTLPAALLAGTAVIIWVLVTGWGRLDPGTMVFVFTVAIGGFGYAIWSTYGSRPRRLAGERQALEDVSRDLRGAD